MNTATAHHARSLIDLQSLKIDDLNYLIDTAGSFKEILTRQVKKAPTLRGKSVALLFFEPSTRTRTSFEHAAKILSADTYNLAGSSSSLVKGETLRDTMLTLSSMAIDTFVIRHSFSGSAEMAANYIPGKTVINAGDGTHEHPTQGLLDLLTIKESKGHIEGLKVAIIGDITHSRVARSNVWGLSKLGAEVRLAGPPTLLPTDTSSWPASLVTTDIDQAIEGADVVICLRIQLERQDSAYFPNVREYSKLFGVTAERLRGASHNVIVMHPGPMNRGVEISSSLADDTRYSVITHQVTNGVAVRMAALFWAMGGASA
jgi:aspartate carbamoyltransferase catalytic subunit